MTTTKSKSDNYEIVPTDEKFEDEKTDNPGFGVRHVQCIIVFLYLSVAFLARAQLSVSIVAMVDDSAFEGNEKNINDTANDVNYNYEQSEEYLTYDESYTTEYYNDFTAVVTTETENVVNYTINKNNSSDGESIWNVNRKYKWSKKIQEMILGSFFVGYFIMNVPMGVVAQRYGGKLPLQISLFVNGVITTLSPWIIAWGGYKAACACRIIQGLSQGGTYPGSIKMLSSWVPLSERGSLSTYSFTGSMVGTIIAFQVGGLLAASSWGWPSIFWFVGILCLLTFAVVTLFATATPQKHKFISEKEKKFILGGFKPKTETKMAVPYKAIFTSKPVWAVIAPHIGSSVSFFYLFTQVPSYMHYILHFDVKKSGILSSLPYIANIVASIIMGYFSDYCINRNIISLKHTRILYNSIASVGMAVSLASVSFIQTPGLAVACLVLAMFSHAGVHAGWMVNYMDLSPNYSATLVSIGNTIMNVFTIIMPLVISTILVDVTNKYQWRIILLLVAGLAFICNLIYVFFMSAEVQSWNDCNGNDNKQLESVKEEKNEKCVQ